MIARKWKCLCPERHKDGFIEYLYRTGVEETSATPGFLGAQVLEREVDGKVEITLVTFWEGYEAVKLYAGEDYTIAKLYPDDYKYEIEPDREVDHYRVVDVFFASP